MGQIITFPSGGYRYIKGVFQYSAGVAADPGFEIERARFQRPVPLADGFRAIAAHLASVARPLAALCACELRSPAPFTEEGFLTFNRGYVETLEQWGIYCDGRNPVARSNVCPEIEPPAVPGFYAFAYTVPARPDARPTFHIAGSGEAPEGQGTYRDRIIRRGDTSAGGLREKARYVLGEMERRMQALGFGWAQVTATQVYTVYDVHPILAEEIVRRGATPHGLTWHYARPPVVGLDYEMDVRGVAREIVL
ncbi:MAG: hypothetical protein H6Q86_46 [candidate division NC10 bacterium]|jgi:hypothetical protein|nr:hypothetical protein [candidate division NC10 bacterium]